MSKSSFSLEILSPQGTVFKDEVDSVSLPTYSGRITILPNHAPLLAPRHRFVRTLTVN